MDVDQAAKRGRLALCRTQWHQVQRGGARQPPARGRCVATIGAIGAKSALAKILRRMRQGLRKSGLLNEALSGALDLFVTRGS